MLFYTKKILLWCETRIRLLTVPVKDICWPSLNFSYVFIYFNSHVYMVFQATFFWYMQYVFDKGLQELADQQC